MKGIGRILLPLGVLMLLVCACGGKSKVIPEKKMQKILEDVLLADQWTYSNDEFASQADTTLFYEAVFNTYGYDSDDFKASVEYYMKDPQRFSRMLKRAALSLEARSAKLKQAQEKPELEMIETLE